MSDNAGLPSMTPEQEAKSREYYYTPKPDTIEEYAGHLRLCIRLEADPIAVIPGNPRWWTSDAGKQNKRALGLWAPHAGDWPRPPDLPDDVPSSNAYLAYLDDLLTWAVLRSHCEEQQPSTAADVSSQPEWESIATATLFARQSEIKVLGDLHRILVNNGYPHTLQALYGMTKVLIPAATAAGIYTPKTKDKRVRRGHRTADGRLEAYVDDDE